jgi:pimeloyl-ACP methyl ester carboxylesterase
VSDDLIERRAREAAEASVQVGSTVTGYHRLGSGPPLLLLRRGNAPVWQSILPVLVTRFRLLVPRIPEDEPDFDRWLGGFLDGLGVDGTRVIADRSLATQAIGFARAEPERVERLVLLLPGPGPELGPESLVVDPAAPADALIEAVTSFLD